MAPHRNNARKAAARAVQRANPGMSYQEALAQVAKTSPANPNPLDLAVLLSITSGQDVRDQYARAGLDLMVPLGLSEAGAPVSLNFDAVARAADGIGPHGLIFGPGALTFALTLATALRAVNDASALHVVFGGRAVNTTAVVAAVDHVIAGIDSPVAGTAAGDDAQAWPQWVAAELERRTELLKEAGVADAFHLDDMPRLFLMIVVGKAQTADKTTALERVMRCGRSLGIHVILVRDADVALSQHVGIESNVVFRLALDHRGLATVTRSSGELTTFTPAVLAHRQLQQWIVDARSA